MRSLLVGIISVTAMSIVDVGYADSQHGSASVQGTKLVQTEAALRDVWLGHIFWVREVVRGLTAKDSAAAQVAEGRAVDNAKQIAAAIEPFYGQPASDQLFKLLAGHYKAVRSHASATIAGDTAEAQEALGQLSTNAGEIAAFLSSANPHLPKQTLNSLLIAHGGHHVQQNQQLSRGDFDGEARTWDEMRTHIYAVSDALSQALAQQFPAKF